MEEPGISPLSSQFEAMKVASIFDNENADDDDERMMRESERGSKRWQKSFFLLSLNYWNKNKIKVFFNKLFSKNYCLLYWF